MIYDGTVHLAMNRMHSVVSVSGDVIGVKRFPSYQALSHSSPATFVYVNLIHKLRRRVSISTSFAIWRMGRVCKLDLKVSCK